MEATRSAGLALGIVGALLVCGTAATAGAQTRPLQTEEAETAAGGTVVVELGGDFIRDEPAFLAATRRDRADGPIVRFVLSPADNVEMDVEWVARVASFNEPGRRNVSDWGDVTLRSKLRLFDGSTGARATRACWPTVAARFGVTLPETKSSTGIGPNMLRTSVQLLLTWRPAGFGVHANAGLALYDDVFRIRSQRDFLHYGIALERGLGPRLAMVAELAGLQGDGMLATEPHHELRAGLRLRTGRVRWDAALRRGLGEWDGTWGATTGLSWILRTGAAPRSR